MVKEDLRNLAVISQTNFIDFVVIPFVMEA